MLNKNLKICSSVYLMALLITPGYADEHFPFLAEVSKESVNVRCGPNTNFDKIDKLKKGTQVVVLGRSYEWYKIQPLSTTNEYIRSDYVKIKEGSSLALVLGDNVNIRSSPNSEASSLGEIKKGTVVKVLEQVTSSGATPQSEGIGWCRLSPVAGTVAWVNRDFLQEISPDVPSSMMVQDESWPSTSTRISTSSTTVTQEPPTIKVISSSITLRGTLEPLAQSPREDVHYEIVIDDKSVYYLQDIPQLSFFANAVVDVEGAVVPDWQKKSMYPLVHINKIALVL